MSDKGRSIGRERSESMGKLEELWNRKRERAEEEGEKEGSFKKK